MGYKCAGCQSGARRRSVVKRPGHSGGGGGRSRWRACICELRLSLLERRMDDMRRSDAIVCLSMIGCRISMMLFVYGFVYDKRLGNDH